MSSAFIPLQRARFDLDTAEANVVRSQGVAYAAGVRQFKQVAINDLERVINAAQEAKEALQQELDGRRRPRWKR